MGCATVGRLVLVVLNLVFLLVSLALIATGVVLKFFIDKVLPYLGDFNAVADEKIRSELKIPDMEEVTQLPFVAEVGTALLVFGCVLFVISFCACCGACCQWRPLLIVASKKAEGEGWGGEMLVVMSVMVILQAVLGGLFLSKNSVMHQKIKDSLVEEMGKNYKEDGDSVITYAVNMMNYLLDCCGINGWEDFPQKEPVKTCCKSEIMTSSDATIQASCNVPPAGKPLEEIYNKEGCYEKLLDKALSQLTLAAVILGLILGLQVVEIIFAIVIVNQANSVGPV